MRCIVAISLGFALLQASCVNDDSGLPTGREDGGQGGGGAGGGAGGNGGGGGSGGTGGGGGAGGVGGQMDAGSIDVGLIDGVHADLSIDPSPRDLDQEATDSCGGCGFGQVCCPCTKTCYAKGCGSCCMLCQPDGGSTQTCGGFTGAKCTSSGDFCDYNPGDCGANDASGICQPKPTFCPSILNPVCGCDGKTYTNDCVRQIAGISRRYDGKCR